LTAGQRADLIAFLESLTDEALLRDSRFANPWTTMRASPPAR
jgi:cytochrome c peroxidase